jgi:hypothetical protein
VWHGINCFSSLDFSLFICKIKDWFRSRFPFLLTLISVLKPSLTIRTNMGRKVEEDPRVTTPREKAYPRLNRKWYHMKEQGHYWGRGSTEMVCFTSSTIILSQLSFSLHETNLCGSSAGSFEYGDLLVWHYCLCFLL